MPKVSVCIPVYGVEKYIERCASKDIWRQTPLSIKLGIISDNIFPWESKLIVLAACINRKLISRIISYVRNKKNIRI